jgi:WD40 repeat protein
MNGSVEPLLSPDGNYIIGSGSDGDIYRWDVRTHKYVGALSNETDRSRRLRRAILRLVQRVESLSLLGTERLFFGNTLLRQTKTDPSVIFETSWNILTRLNGDVILAMSTGKKNRNAGFLHGLWNECSALEWPTSRHGLNYVWSMYCLKSKIPLRS